MRLKRKPTTLIGAATCLAALATLHPASAATPGPSQPGSPGAAVAASEPFAVDAPGMRRGTQTFAGTGPIIEFPAFPNPLGFSCEVAIANNGDLITDEFLGGSMGRVDPHTGQVHSIDSPNLASLPGGQNRGPDGDIWFGDVGGNGLGRVDAETEEITYYDFPWGNVSFDLNLPLLGDLGVNTGPGVTFDTSWATDGKIYFTLIGLNAIGSLDPETGEWEKFPIPTPLAGPVAMEIGPGGTVAITEGIANKIALFDIDTHEWEEHRIPTLGPGTTFPAGLTVSPDDRYLYFGETLAGKVGRFDSVTKEIKEYDLNALRPGGLLGGVLNGINGNPLPQPGQLRFGSDGKLYIVSGTFTGGGTIGQLDVATETYRELNTPTPVSMPCDLNNTVPGKIIFASFRSNRVSYIDIPNTVDISNTYPLHG